jgi:hypothetical protein
MMDIRWIAAATLLPLAACSTMDGGADPASPSPPAEAACNGDAGQSFVGQTASAETGAALLRATGARTLRWVAPGMAVTMDYRADRLTVSYDAAYKIERVSCG